MAQDRSIDQSHKRRKKGFDAFTIAMAAFALVVVGYVFYLSIEASSRVEVDGPPVYFKDKVGLWGPRAAVAAEAAVGREGKGDDRGGFPAGGDFTLISADGPVSLKEYR